MKELNISKRLAAICSFVAPNAVLLDVGTDHAYVPIYLLLNGVVDRAWASDVNSGPLEIAAENAEQYGLGERLALYLSDGLMSCCCGENEYDHFVIAGMGGELIWSIINDSQYIKTHRPTLILQPMTMQSFLRKQLTDNSFEITNEHLIFEDGKYYSILKCFYSGERQFIGDFEAAFGKNISHKIENGDTVCLDFIKYQRELLLRIKKGKEIGCQDTSNEESLIASIDDLLKRNGYES